MRFTFDEYVSDRENCRMLEIILWIKFYNYLLVVSDFSSMLCSYDLNTQ